MLLVSVSDPGLFDTFKEAGAAAKQYKDARSNSASELVRELSADPGMGFGLGKNPQQLETETLSALAAAASILKEKASQRAATLADPNKFRTSGRNARAPRRGAVGLAGT